MKHRIFISIFKRMTGNVVFTNFLLPVLLAFFCTGCFTGIESTKKIQLTKEDKKSVMPAAEDLVLSGIDAMPLSKWEPGKRFLVTDDKLSLLLETDNKYEEGSALNNLKGELFTYEGRENRINVDGSLKTILLFSCNNHTYKYNTAKSADNASSEITSSKLPFMIDVERVEKIKDVLNGKTLWTLSNLRYDATGNRVQGKKYVAIEVTDVQPGNEVFPVKIFFRNEKNEEYFLLMNYDGDDSGSRRFKNLFSLTNPRLKYKNVSDEAWVNIQNGTVAPGMTKDECRISIGYPSELDTGHTHSTLLDVWKYPDGRILRFADGILVDVWR